jgi:hypothetical protein
MPQVNYSNTAGLVFVAKQSGTAVSSINLDNVFTNTYAQYRIIIRLSTVTNFEYLPLRLRASGVTLNSGYNNQYIYNASTTVGSGRSLTETFLLQVSQVPTSSNNAISIIEIINPFQTKNTSGFAFSIDRPETSGIETGYNVGSTDDTTSYDGLNVSQTGGNITGDVYIYGYVNS